MDELENLPRESCRDCGGHSQAWVEEYPDVPVRPETEKELELRWARNMALLEDLMGPIEVGGTNGRGSGSR